MDTSSQPYKKVPQSFGFRAASGKRWPTATKKVTLEDVMAKLEEVSDAIESLIEPIAEAISAVEMDEENTDEEHDSCPE